MFLIFTRNDTVIRSFDPSFGPFDLHVDTPFGPPHASSPFGTNDSSQSLTQVCITRCQQRVSGCSCSLQNCSSSASFLGVHPFECQKYTEKIRNPPLTFTRAWVIHPSSPGIDSIVPSSAPTTASRLLSLQRKLLLMYTFDPHCLLSSVILAAPLQTSILPWPLC